MEGSTASRSVAESAALPQASSVAKELTYEVRSILDRRLRDDYQRVPRPLVHVPQPVAEWHRDFELDGPLLIHAVDVGPGFEEEHLRQISVLVDGRATRCEI